MASKNGAVSPGGTSSKKRCNFVLYDPNAKLKASSGFVGKGIDLYYGLPKKFCGPLGQTERDLLGLKNELEEDLNERLTSLFPTPEKVREGMSCSLCKGIAEPPAYSCINSHLICGMHLKTTSYCPYNDDFNLESCDMPFTPIRTLYYECLYNNTKMECINKKNGCKELVLRGGKTDHEEECKFSEKNVNVSESETNQPDQKKSTDATPEVAEDPVPDSKEKEPSAAEEAKNIKKLKARVDDWLKSGIIKDDDNKLDVKQIMKEKNIAAQLEAEFAPYRFTEEDVLFIVENSAYLEKFVWEIPSVKELRIPKEIVKRELQRFQIALMDAIEVDRRLQLRAAQKKKK